MLNDSLRAGHTAARLGSCLFCRARACRPSLTVRNFACMALLLREASYLLALRPVLCSVPKQAQHIRHRERKGGVLRQHQACVRIHCSGEAPDSHCPAAAAAAAARMDKYQGHTCATDIFHSSDQSRTPFNDLTQRACCRRCSTSCPALQWPPRTSWPQAMPCTRPSWCAQSDCQRLMAQN